MSRITPPDSRRTPPDLSKYGIYNRPGYTPGRAPRGILVVFILLCVAGGLFFYARGKVVKINTGDSFIIISLQNSFDRVRLYGVDCPELDQPGGREAVRASSELIFMQEVALTPLEPDEHGRFTSLVQLPGGLLLNEELVRLGLAWVDPRHCREAWCGSWARLEEEARAARRGLWADENPVPPWQWRGE